MRLRDVLDEVKDHPYLTVPEDMELDRLAQLLQEQPGVRSIYVLDTDGRLAGAVSPGRLIRILTASRHSGEFTPRRLMKCITCHHVRDIMTPKLIYASPDNGLDEVVDKMIQGNIKEIPVLDSSGKLLKNPGLLELWSKMESSVA